MARPWDAEEGGWTSDKWLVWGPDPGGQLLQVIFVVDEDGAVFILHARRLTEPERRRYRRSRR